MKALFLILSLILTTALFGCSKESSQPNAPSQSQTEWTELTPELLARLDHELAGARNERLPMPTHSETPTPSADDYDLYAVAYLWGNLFNIPGPAVMTDWSGTLSFNGEAIITPFRTIDFEDGEDSTYLTNNPSVSAWASATGDPDGIVFHVAVKRGVTYIIEPSLTFSTQPISFSIRESQLAGFAALYSVDGLNFVAVIARKIDQNICARGTLTGEWVRNSISGENGTLSGVWISEPGDQHGVFAGTFWTDNDGTRAFEATVSEVLTGVVIGVMRGTWIYDDPRMCPTCGQSRGRFSGKLYYSNSAAVGDVDGEFGDLSLPPEQNNLPLKGEWRVYCPHVSSGVPTTANQ